MKIFGKSIKSTGFTLIELIVVFAIIALIFTFGVAYWKNYQIQKRFLTDFDSLVTKISEAQQAAKAYGKDPTGYSTTGTIRNGQTRDKYVCRLARKGMNATDTIDTYTGLTITTTAAVNPMTQSELNTKFNGVALNFGYKASSAADDYVYDFCFLFESDGTLYFPSPGYAYEDVRIDVAGNSGKLMKRIYINQLTGNIRTEDVK
ncbi:MAG: prepilin-type N-terminal cleavage/methylation domain-containing protein [Firmicutes bacterium]|nr:prepilin-type N-terminal cleavage/methylation domain-containing protein [Bacillota bacterium]